MSYRKREIAHWNHGKGYKGTRKAKERAYVADEIQVQVAEQDDSFRYPYHAHKPNREAQIAHRIDWYERTLAEYDREPKASWRCAFASHARESLRQAKKELKELQDAKVRS